ncbi:hypothetical protein BDEG_25521 [Batrachochytrium dendrobatidis JEL423]|uniref:Uncharacterized protein n=1 Tax=Batrachochytrium dendrobatidis (strain JEL423) TaxID=403673 RepID=A0A177WRN1_BATDL|nr:hypothetical protein BDEG_25521 [Batrachochytrium dendrobatidis JEL423]
MVQSGFDTVPTPTFRVSSTQPLASDSDGVTTVGPAQTSSKSGSKNSSNGGSAINVSTETSRVPASNSGAANNSSTINSSQLEPSRTSNIIQPSASSNIPLFTNNPKPDSVSTTYSGSTLIPFTSQPATADALPGSSDQNQTNDPKSLTESIFSQSLESLTNMAGIPSTLTASGVLGTASPTVLIVNAGGSKPNVLPQGMIAAITIAGFAILAAVCMVVVRSLYKKPPVEGATAAVAGDSFGGDGTATMAAIDATHDDGANGTGDAMASTSSRSAAAANAPFEFKNVGSNSAVPTAAAGIFAAVAALGKKKRRAPEDTTSDLQPRYRVNSKAAGTSAASFNSNYPVAVLLRNESEWENPIQSPYSDWRTSIDSTMGPTIEPLRFSMSDYFRNSIVEEMPLGNADIKTDTSLSLSRTAARTVEVSEVTSTVSSVSAAIHPCNGSSDGRPSGEGSGSFNASVLSNQPLCRVSSSNASESSTTHNAAIRNVSKAPNQSHQVFENADTMSCVNSVASNVQSQHFYSLPDESAEHYPHKAVLSRSRSSNMLGVSANQLTQAESVGTTRPMFLRSTSAASLNQASLPRMKSVGSIQSVDPVIYSDASLAGKSSSMQKISPFFLKREWSVSSINREEQSIPSDSVSFPGTFQRNPSSSSFSQDPPGLLRADASTTSLNIEPIHDLDTTSTLNIKMSSIAEPSTTTINIPKTPIDGDKDTLPTLMDRSSVVAIPLQRNSDQHDSEYHQKQNDPFQVNNHSSFLTPHGKTPSTFDPHMSIYSTIVLPQEVSPNIVSAYGSTNDVDSKNAQDEEWGEKIQDDHDHDDFMATPQGELPDETVKHTRSLSQSSYQSKPTIGTNVDGMFPVERHESETTLKEYMATSASGLYPTQDAVHDQLPITALDSVSPTYSDDTVTLPDSLQHKMSLSSAANLVSVKSTSKIEQPISQSKLTAISSRPIQSSGLGRTFVLVGDSMSSKDTVNYHDADSAVEQYAPEITVKHHQIFEQVVDQQNSKSGTADSLPLSVGKLHNTIMAMHAVDSSSTITPDDHAAANASGSDIGGGNNGASKPLAPTLNQPRHVEASTASIVGVSDQLQTKANPTEYAAVSHTLDTSIESTQTSDQASHQKLSKSPVRPIPLSRSSTHNTDGFTTSIYDLAMTTSRHNILDFDMSKPLTFTDPLNFEDEYDTMYRPVSTWDAQSESEFYPQSHMDSSSSIGSYGSKLGSSSALMSHSEYSSQSTQRPLSIISRGRGGSQRSHAHPFNSLGSTRTADTQYYTAPESFGTPMSYMDGISLNRGDDLGPSQSVFFTPGTQTQTQDVFMSDASFFTAGDRTQASISGGGMGDGALQTRNPSNGINGTENRDHRPESGDFGDFRLSQVSSYQTAGSSGRGVLRGSEDSHGFENTP